MGDHSQPRSSLTYLWIWEVVDEPVCEERRMSLQQYLISPLIFVDVSLLRRAGVHIPKTSKV